MKFHSKGQNYLSTLNYGGHENRNRCLTGRLIYKVPRFAHIIPLKACPPKNIEHSENGVLKKAFLKLAGL